jgi:hypothetical protein
VASDLVSRRHDLRRLFKSVGAEIGVDPVILNLLVGHTVKGVDKHYLAKLRISVLRAAAQRIADEIDNPRELAEGDSAVEVAAMHKDIRAEVSSRICRPWKAWRQNVTPVT